MPYRTVCCVRAVKEILYTMVLILPHGASGVNSRFATVHDKTQSWKVIHLTLVAAIINFKQHRGQPATEYSAMQAILSNVDVSLVISHKVRIEVLILDALLGLLGLALDGTFTGLFFHDLSVLNAWVMLVMR